MASRPPRVVPCQLCVRQGTQPLTAGPNATSEILRIGVTVNGERDMLGLWAGDGAEGVKFWLQVLTELKNRGVADVCIAVCDGLKGLPDAINTVWEFTTVQACIIHLIRNTFRYASRKYWDQISHDLRPVYTAATEADAKARFAEFTEK